ncbi:hypothetical protein [Nocardia salmonicida]
MTTPLPPILVVPGLLADRSGAVAHAPDLGWDNVDDDSSDP